MQEIINDKNILNISIYTLSFYKGIFLNTGLKIDNEIVLENKIDEIKEIKLLKNINNITFIYIDIDLTRITSKFFKEFIEEKNYGKQIGVFDYLVFFLKNNDDYFIYGVDCLNKTKLKFSSFKIDNIGFEDYKTGVQKYRNRTINEQLLQLKKDLDEGRRDINRRMILSFFEKKNLTEEFYRIYKDEIFEKIKKANISKTNNEGDLNHFILVNLNRLLFIHFLDKKGDIFKDYDVKFGSFLSFLKYKFYKNFDNKKSFYEDVLDILFFEIFSKPKKDRNLEKLEKLGINEIFYELPYLNGGLFKKSRFDEIGFVIEDKQIEDFIEKIIDGFNFTIEEDTPLEVKISVDPELLGYIFENLIQEYDNSKDDDNERSKGGIFYTPKIEVDFMCRQSIVEYLSKKEEFSKLEKKEELYKLVYRENGKNTHQEYGSFSEYEIEKIFEYLEDLKVVDPTCGSGAFLVGMLQTIIDIEDILKEHHAKHYSKLVNDYKIINKNLFARKKELIKNTLYGVDIKTWAVEIAKLRLWLSMILDVESEYFEKEESKETPLLPSFSFKIVCGDSILNMIGTEIIPIDFLNSINIDTSLKNKIKKLISLKEDFYNNSLKDEKVIIDEEKQIYIGLLNEKIRFDKKTLENAKSGLSLNQTNLFGDNQTSLDLKGEKLLKNYIKLTEEKLSQNQDLLTQITIKDKLPFAWSIDFAEIFQEKGGFDILVGNPPYVRQEAIEDPNGNIKDKKEYKNLLEKTINGDYLDEINKNFDLNIKVGGRSDLYVYFYFRGLKLINDKGIFAFITSNSWLDVDFGSSLQEFLLKFVDNISIYNNSAERSFANASINTIIAIFDKPRFYKKDMVYKKLRDLENDFGKTKFINFKKSFEEVIFSENFREIEDIYKFSVVENLEEKTIKTGEISFRKKSNQDFRVVYIDNNSLFIDGSEKEETKLGSFYKYEGNKWGGKYLKAPDIFFTILEKGGDKLVKLKEIAEVKFGIKTGCNDFFYLPSKYFDIKENGDYYDLIPKEKGLPEGIKIEKEFFNKFIKGPKKSKSINIDYNKINEFTLQCNLNTEFLINKEVLKYIEWGESMNFHDRPSTGKGRKNWYQLPNYKSNGLWWVNLGDRYCFFNNKYNLFSDKMFYNLQINNNFDNIILSLNSYIIRFLMEMTGQELTGSLTFITHTAKEVSNLEIIIGNYINFSQKEYFLNREIKSIFEELGFDKNKNIREQEPNPLEDRKELDDIIFDEIGLSIDERKEVYWSLGELVKSRLDKAKSK